MKPTSDAFVSWLETELDRAAAASPNPGRTETFHRLNRAEYQNAVRDLLALDIDVADLLPADDSSYGFDNIAGVLQVSQSLMERYLAAAKTISRLAVGAPLPARRLATSTGLRRMRSSTIAPTACRSARAAGRWFGICFPQDGEYDIQRRGDGRGRAREPHQLEVTVDGEQVQALHAGGPRRRGDSAVRRLRATSSTAGAGARPARTRSAWRSCASPPLSSSRCASRFRIRVSRETTAVLAGRCRGSTSVTIAGPYQPAGPGRHAEPPAHLRLPARRQPLRKARCAKTILTTLARRAYRGR